MALRQGLKNNWTLKLASVAIAFLIWLVIGNINDPVIQKVYSSIPVTITNGSYIESRGMTAGPWPPDGQCDFKGKYVQSNKKK